MKNLQFKQTEILQKEQLRNIIGGASATAYCIDNRTGKEYMVTCSGNYSCSSSDYNGCSCTSAGGAIVDYKSCSGAFQ